MKPIKFLLTMILGIIRITISLLKHGNTVEALSQLESLEEILENEEKSDE